MDAEKLSSPNYSDNNPYFGFMKVYTVLRDVCLKWRFILHIWGESLTDSHGNVILTSVMYVHRKRKVVRQTGIECFFSPIQFSVVSTTFK